MQLSLHRDQGESIERGSADVLLSASQQGLDHDTHATHANQVRVVAGVGGRGEVVQHGRALVEAGAAQHVDLGLGESIQLCRKRVPDLGDLDLLVGQAGRSIELREVASNQASGVRDVVGGIAKDVEVGFLIYLRYM